VPFQPACCCSDCTSHDCLSGGTIDTGCCHSCDHLLLWCERPGFSGKREVLWNPPGTEINCEICEVKSWSGLPPVQAIYQYYGTFWRVQYPGGPQPQRGLKNLLPPYPECPTRSCFGDDTNCTSCNPSGPLGGNTSGCECNGATTNSVYSKYQLDRYQADPETRWAPELVCWKGGDNLSPTIGIGRLDRQVIGIVYFERWWRIAQGTSECNEYRIVVPSCTKDPITGDYSCSGGPAVQGDDLVPKWWIHACSGVPLFDFDITDAVARKFISSEDADQIRSFAAQGLQPDQTILARMAIGGYFDSKDWRAEQRQAYVDLHARFPDAGYGACIQNVEDMDELGPFRRRLTESFEIADIYNDPEPILRASDATASGSTLQAMCSIDYPGGWGSNDEEDYNFWAERQWVYFRGVPGGWIWAGWNAPGDQACVELGITDEEQAILHGCGRFDGSCIEAIRGWPLPPPTCTPCVAACKCSGITYTNCSCAASCPECDPIPEVGCGGSPQCDGNDTGNGSGACEQFGVEPFCEGLRMVYAYYKWVPMFAGTCESCDEGPTGGGKETCARSVLSYLIPARVSSNSWDDVVPYTCRKEIPPLGVPNLFPAIIEAHQATEKICVGIGPDPIDPGLYSESDICCGGFCPSFSGELDCCGRVKNNCEASTDCPPHSLQGQRNCIGHDIECQIEESP
jgi:hypothetical protein